ncbi:MAG: hypothetical protein JWM37_622 [Candidatus Saccharibacteria bacterium]|nr:hypothetical protein [Candidatus Saccharibacteria bacterium]
MQDRKPLIRQVRICAIGLFVLASAMLICGGIIAVVRGTGMTDTQVKMGYSLALLIISTVVAYACVRKDFRGLLFGAIGQCIIVMLYVLLDRFDNEFMSWLLTFPLLFALAMFILVIQTYNIAARQALSESATDSRTHVRV